MTTREIVIALALLLLPVAAAQGDEPTTNESDYDTEVPPGDESYLDEAENADYSDPEADYSANASENSDENATEAPAPAESADAPTESDPDLTAEDLDMSLPADDAAWLDEEEAAMPPASAASTGGKTKATPGPGALALLAGAAVALVALRRR